VTIQQDVKIIILDERRGFEGIIVLKRQRATVIMCG
jgi:hypothetical protein